ncbi:MAG: hypothetical protein JM58_18060 [Peptococcaceae bacterium BICA1-8]|nr:MAG: hypothetical protein JM58_18060 [Peptococcaceae bacterium BICA1-8]
MDHLALHLNNISFGYSRQKSILNNITLKIAYGQMVGIIGPNGAGKSTLIKIILGLLNPTQGQVFINGTMLNNFKEWSKIGYLSQKAIAFNTSFPASVEEVIATPLNSDFLLPVTTKSVKKQVSEALKLVELSDYRNTLMGNLSGGQQQRVFLARTLVSQPEILILDEPFVGIDENSQQSIINILKRLHHQGITILFVSHDLRWMKNDTDLLLCLDNGTLN